HEGLPGKGIPDALLVGGHVSPRPLKHSCFCAEQPIAGQWENLTPRPGALDSQQPCYNSLRKAAKGKCSAVFRLRLGFTGH
ncbi:MAG: hypothetical protein WCD01_02555, partial [Candidatus Sulfotelmatobacter sp.]